MTIIRPNYRSEDLIKMRNDAIEAFGGENYRQFRKLGGWVHLLTIVVPTAVYLCLTSFLCKHGWPLFLVAVLISLLYYVVMIDELSLLMTGGVSPVLFRLYRTKSGWSNLLENKFQSIIKELSSLEGFLSYLDRHPDCTVKLDRRYLIAACKDDKTVNDAFVFLSREYGVPVLKESELDCSYLNKAIEAFLGGNDGQTEN